jgi:hypothetical protein
VNFVSDLLIALAAAMALLIVQNADSRETERILLLALLLSAPASLSAASYGEYGTASGSGEPMYLPTAAAQSQLEVQRWPSRRISCIGLRRSASPSGVAGDLEFAALCATCGLPQWRWELVPVLAEYRDGISGKRRVTAAVC